MAMKFTITKQKLLPEGYVRFGRALAFPWLELEPGDAFFAPGKTKKEMSGKAGSFRQSRKVDWQFDFWEAEEMVDEEGAIDEENGQPTKGCWVRRQEVEKKDENPDRPPRPPRDDTGANIRALKETRK